MNDARFRAFYHLSSATRDSLIRQADEVGQFAAPEIEVVEFQSRTLAPNVQPMDLTTQVDSWIRGGSKFIYVFDTAAGADLLAQVLAGFAAAKSEERDDRAYARANGSCQTLYVGSSSSLSRRFREHLGYGARGTYALHLCQWISVLDLRIRFIAARYPAAVPAELLGLLEDRLWEQLNPMFGRKGRR